VRLSAGCLSLVVLVFGAFGVMGARAVTTFARTRATLGTWPITSIRSPMSPGCDSARAQASTKTWLPQRWASSTRPTPSSVTVIVPSSWQSVIHGHVEFVDAAVIAEIETAYGLEPIRTYSFLFPRNAGRIFRHNETVAISRKRQRPTAGESA
jgi:hypothetical protein